MNEVNLSVDECIAKVQEFLNDMKYNGFYNDVPRIHVKTVTRVNKYDKVTRTWVPAPLTYFAVHIEIRNNGGFALYGKGLTVTDAFNRCAETIPALRLEESSRKLLREAELVRQNNRDLVRSIYNGVARKENFELNALCYSLVEF